MADNKGLIALGLAALAALFLIIRAGAEPVVPVGVELSNFVATPEAMEQGDVLTMSVDATNTTAEEKQVTIVFSVTKV